MRLVINSYGTEPPKRQRERARIWLSATVLAGLPSGVRDRHRSAPPDRPGPSLAQASRREQGGTSRGCASSNDVSDPEEGATMLSPKDSPVRSASVMLLMGMLSLALSACGRGSVASCQAPRLDVSPQTLGAGDVLTV